MRDVPLLTEVSENDGIDSRRISKIVVGCADEASFLKAINAIAWGMGGGSTVTGAQASSMRASSKGNLINGTRLEDSGEALFELVALRIVVALQVNEQVRREFQSVVDEG